MFKTINLRKLITSLAFPLIIGFTGGFLSGNMSDSYQNLTLPPGAPPGWVFGVIWTILYLLMGLSLYLIRTSPDTQLKKYSLWAFTAQLIVNFFWPILFFGMLLYCLSAIWLGLLIVLIVITIVLFYRQNRPSAYLLIPYLLWCCFALYLNIGACLLN